MSCDCSSVGSNEDPVTEGLRVAEAGEILLPRR